MLIYLRNVSFTITRVKYGLQLILFHTKSDNPSTPSKLRINDILLNNLLNLLIALITTLVKLELN